MLPGVSLQSDAEAKVHRIRIRVRITSDLGIAILNILRTFLYVHKSSLENMVKSIYALNSLSRNSMKEKQDLPSFFDIANFLSHLGRIGFRGK